MRLIFTRVCWETAFLHISAADLVLGVLVSRTADPHKLLELPLAHLFGVPTATDDFLRHEVSINTASDAIKLYYVHISEEMHLKWRLCSL